MRRFLIPATLLSGLLAGCAEPGMFRDSAFDKDSDMKQNLRDGRSWKEQESLLKDLRGDFDSSVGGAGGARLEK
jgi:hypothetical protein